MHLWQLFPLPSHISISFYVSFYIMALENLKIENLHLTRHLKTFLRRSMVNQNWNFGLWNTNWTKFRYRTVKLLKKPKWEFIFIFNIKETLHLYTLWNLNSIRKQKVYQIVLLFIKKTQNILNGNILINQILF